VPITLASWCFNCYVVTGGTEGPVVVDPAMLTVADDLAPLLTSPLASFECTLETGSKREDLVDGGRPWHRANGRNGVARVAVSIRAARASGNPAATEIAHLQPH
jgi:hypothetical protein